MSKMPWDGDTEVLSNSPKAVSAPIGGRKAMVFLAGSIAALFSAAPAPAQTVDLDKLCAQIADPGYAPIVADGNVPISNDSKRYNLPQGLSEDEREKFGRYVGDRIILLLSLREVQLGEEAEAQLDFLELMLKDGKLPPALDKVRKKIQQETESAKEDVKAFVSHAKYDYEQICPGRKGPTDVVVQPIPNLLLPGLALIGVVAAPMPPANPPTPPAPTSAGEYSLTLIVAGHACKTIGWYDRKSPQPPACGPDNRLGFGDNDKVYVATAANQSQPEFEIVASMRGFSPSVYDLKVHTPDGEKVCKGDATANCVIKIPAKTDDTKWPGTDIIAALDYKGGDRQRDRDNAQVIDGGDAGIRLNYKRPN
jgi:hypothetical protein